MVPKIIVVGSANTDFIVQVPELPAPGETVLGGIFNQAKGGKGANQAVAAARLGGDVTLIARLGQDSLGSEALQGYQHEGIHTEYIVIDPSQPSGAALILVGSNGENMIAVAPGANNCLAPQDVEAAEEVIRQADCLLVQLEIPMETVQKALEIAQKHGILTILNPAPARSMPHDLYAFIDVLTPNQKEAAALLGETDLSADETTLTRLAKATGIPTIVATLGALGVQVHTKGYGTSIPGFQITPVDTTACGDAFNGALAYALSNGKTVIEAAHYANAAGALAAIRLGAQPSLPTAKEVQELIERVGLSH